MALNDVAHGALQRKLDLFDNDFARFAVRGVLAGVYLTLATGFAGMAGSAVEAHAKGIGSLVFAFLFGIGLFAIIVLNGELATGNMMFGSYGAIKKQANWGKALIFIVTTTLLNLVGCVVIAYYLSHTAKFAGMTDTNMISTITEAKFHKSAGGAFLEGIGANFVVNMAIVGAAAAKDFISKFVTIVSFLAVFVGLGLEHVIANFSLMSIAFFASDPLPASMTVGAVATNWAMVWLGNFVGGGLVMGGTYAWLNKTKTSYID